ncbi:MAG: DsbA family oxidoreductase [Rhodocyclaceae bacterium]|nr:DsbA family oxidoreductase [Rhodocyclaceae bacterium]
MMTTIRIDFVSDVACPWCVIGLKSLEQALANLGREVEAEIHFQPFELNPNMPIEGQDITEHLAQKYGASPAQLEVTREAIRARGAELGFVFGVGKRSRIYNTFDSHRMLHWAGLQDEQCIKQRALKHALFAAYFTDGFNPGEHETILRAVAQVGLDVTAARAVLESDRYATEVRAQEEHYLARGIHSVPAVIVDDKHLIHGGQPPEVFEQALRQITSILV